MILQLHTWPILRLDISNKEQNTHPTNMRKNIYAQYTSDIIIEDAQI